MSLEDIYIGVCESMESKKSELVSLLEDITEPSCPQSGEKFQFLGKSDDENRSLRFKWVCSKCVPVPKTGSRACTFLNLQTIALEKQLMLLYSPNAFPFYNKKCNRSATDNKKYYEYFDFLTEFLLLQ